MIRFCSIASGSKGNCFFVEGGGVRLLVDAGLSAREITRRLATIGVVPDSLDCILITHEHIDHISAVPVLSRRHRLDVIGTRGTLDGPSRIGKLSNHVHSSRELSAGETLKIGPMSITSFQVSHDAMDPVGYRIEVSGDALTIASDLGTITHLVRSRFKESTAMIIESNHDIEMLKKGPYPWELKQRILSKHGHLSNDDCADFLREIFHSALSHIELAHLSEVNNEPKLAYNSVKNTLAAAHKSSNIGVALQHNVGTIVTVK